MSDNLDLWNKVCTTDKKYTKEVSYGTFKFTAIQAQYQVRNATEQFGKYGCTWGLKNIKFKDTLFHDNRMLRDCFAVFYYPDGEFEISSCDMLVDIDKYEKYKIDKEINKKLETDITTKALSKLGFNADIFLGEWDSNRYVNNSNNQASYATSNQQSISDADNLPWLNKGKADGSDSEIKEKVKWDAIINKIRTKKSADQNFDVQTVIKALRNEYKISKSTSQDLMNA